MNMSYALDMLAIWERLIGNQYKYGLDMLRE
jgi:hypothetical protein